MSDRGRAIAAAPVEGTLMAANWSSHGEREMSARKRDIRRLADASAPARRSWLARGAFFHDQDLLYLKFLIPESPPALEPPSRTPHLPPPPNPPFSAVL